MNTLIPFLINLVITLLYMNLVEQYLNISYGNSVIMMFIGYFVIKLQFKMYDYFNNKTKEKDEEHNARAI